MIDTHHHIFPPPYLAAARAMDRLHDVVSSKPSLVEWTPAQSLEAMDRFGIRTAITSISTPGVHWGDSAKAASLARACNEWAAEMAREHPGRYGVFASIPLPDVDASLRELEYALDVLHATGIVLMTNYGDRWPGDAALEPFFREANRRRTVVFFHPTAPNCCRGLIPDIGPSMVEYPFDTTRAIVSLLSSGTFTRCPDISWIFSHGGGTLPMLAERIARGIRGKLVERVPNGAMHEFMKLNFDVAAATSAPALSALLRFTRPEKVLLGTDFPFGEIGNTLAGLRGFGLPADQLSAIEAGNAQALLRL